VPCRCTVHAHCYLCGFHSKPQYLVCTLSCPTQAHIQTAKLESLFSTFGRECRTADLPRAKDSSVRSRPSYYTRIYALVCDRPYMDTDGPFVFVSRYTRRQLYAVVSEVGSYASFVPFCAHSRVLSPLASAPTSATPNAQQMEAELTVKFLAFTECYRSRVTCVPYGSVRVRLFFFSI
jgi:Polyketide cyclase / dehydrase and lipid transport